MTLSKIDLNVTLSIAILGINIECHYAECRFLFVVILSVVMLRVVMLSVVMLSVIILSVVVPRTCVTPVGAQSGELVSKADDPSRSVFFHSFTPSFFTSKT
jgi:hypothetical protein